MNDEKRKPSASPLAADLKEKVRALVDAGSVAGAAQRLDITVATLGRALAGLPIARGTRAQIELRLQEVRS